MKKHVTDEKRNTELLQRHIVRRNKRLIKLVSIFTVTSVLAVTLPSVSIGHASDISLQVPVDQTLPDANVQGTGNYIELKYSMDAESKAVFSENTFMIIEQKDRDGVSIEMLDETAFNETDETMFNKVEGLPVYSSPDSGSTVVAELFYGQEVNRVGVGSSWSEITFVSESEEEEPSVVTGYVLSEELTYFPLITATPTPTPKTQKGTTSTPTPTPKPNTGDPAPSATPAPTNTPAPAYDETPFSGTFYAIGGVNVRSGPGTSYSVVRKLVENEQVEVSAKTGNGWYKIGEGQYVKASLLSADPVTNPPSPTPSPSPVPADPTDPAPVEPLPGDPTPTPVPAPEPVPTPAPTPIVVPDPGSCDLLTYARAFIGVPYVYTGASPSGFDCSGFVMYVYAHYYGISLPHQSASIATMGTDVSNQELQVGDVICHDYNSDGRVDHVSLYCGSGIVIHASTSRGGIVEDYIPMGCVVCVRRFF